MLLAMSGSFSHPPFVISGSFQAVRRHCADLLSQGQGHAPTEGIRLYQLPSEGRRRQGDRWCFWLRLRSLDSQRGMGQALGKLRNQSISDSSSLKQQQQQQQQLLTTRFSRSDCLEAHPRISKSISRVKLKLLPTKKKQKNFNSDEFISVFCRLNYSFLFKCFSIVKIRNEIVFFISEYGR